MKKQWVSLAIALLITVAVGLLVRCGSDEDQLVYCTDKNGNPPDWFQQQQPNWCYAAAIQSFCKFLGITYDADQQQLMMYADADQSGLLSNREALAYIQWRNYTNIPVAYMETPLGNVDSTAHDDYNLQLRADVANANHPSLTPLTADHVVLYEGYGIREGRQSTVAIMDPAMSGPYVSFSRLINVDEWNKNIPVYVSQAGFKVHVRIGVPLTPMAAGNREKILTEDEVANLVEDPSGKGWRPRAEVARPRYNPKNCPPPNILGTAPLVPVTVADAVVDAANGAISRSGIGRLVQPGQPFNWALARFAGAYAGTPYPVYSNIYHDCYTEQRLLYYMVPYFSATGIFIGDVKVNSDMTAVMISVGIPKSASMAASATSEFLTFEKVRKMFPDAAQIVPVWQDNEFTAIQSEFFWKVVFSDWSEKNLTIFGDEMVESPLNGKLFRKDVDLRLPSADVALLPNKYNLAQNYPNPFNATTQISFDIPEASQVKLEIFNVLGEKVMVLVNEYMSPGHKIVTWDGRNLRGEQVSSGIYFDRLVVDGKPMETRKLHLLK